MQGRNKNVEFISLITVIMTYTEWGMSSQTHYWFQLTCSWHIHCWQTWWFSMWDLSPEGVLNSHSTSPTPVYKWQPVNCFGDKQLDKMLGVICDGLVSHSGGLEILLIRRFILQKPEILAGNIRMGLWLTQIDWGRIYLPYWLLRLLFFLLRSHSEGKC